MSGDDGEPRVVGSHQRFTCDGAEDQTGFGDFTSRLFAIVFVLLLLIHCANICFIIRLHMAAYIPGVVEIEGVSQAGLNQTMVAMVLNFRWATTLANYPDLDKEARAAMISSASRDHHDKRLKNWTQVILCDNWLADPKGGVELAIRCLYMLDEEKPDEEEPGMGVPETTETVEVLECE